MTEVLEETGLTREEHERLQKYSAIMGEEGRLDFLTGEEKCDLKQLLKRTLVYQGTMTEDEVSLL